MTKRLFDIVCSLAGLIVTAPLFAVIALLIKVSSPGPVLYRGVRTGRYGKPFVMYKFRSMVPDAEATGVTSTPADDPRLTRTGKFLKKYNLDELPQLINILKGDMSFVGPRPQVKWATDLYTEEEKAVLTVRPGLTDLAYVAIPNEAEILRGSKDPDKDYMEKIHPEKTRLQLEYVKRHTLLLDLTILLKTMLLSIRR